MRSARRRKTHPSTRTAFESLEPRTMLAGLAPDSLSGLGSTTAVLLPGVSSYAGIVLSGGSPTPGSGSGTGGSQSTGLTLPSNSGSGAGSSSTGSSGSSNSGGLMLPSNSGSGQGSPSAGSSGSSNSGGLMLPSNSGSGAGSSSAGSSSGSISGGLTLPSNAGSGAGSSTSGATGGSTLNGAAPPSFQAMPSLAEFLPAGYQLRPNSASDPVFQQAYAQWMASSAATSAANNTQTMQGGTSAAGSSSNPLTTSGAWSVFDGEFWRNYAHYLTNPSEMDDGLETGFYWSMGIAATAGTAAGGAVVWGAAGGSTFGVGVVKTCETSVIYTINGSIYMGSPTGVCNVTSCSWATMGYWTSCTGIPILSGESAIAGASGGLWFVKYPCLSRAIQAFANGWAPL